MASQITALCIALLIVSVLGCAEKKYVATDSNNPLSKAEAVCNPENRLPTSGLCLTFSWEKPPTEKLSGIFIFKIWRPNLADNTPIPTELGDSATVELWMPHMGGGHGSSPVVVEKKDVGTYRARRVFFSMPGQWEIRFTIKSGDNVIDKLTLLYKF